MRRALPIVILVAVVAAALAGSGWTRGAHAADPPAGAADQGAQGYIVVYRDAVDADARTGQLERAQGFASEFRYRHALKGFAARLNAQQLARIEADPDVAFVSPDGTVQAVDALATGELTPTGTLRIGATTSTTAPGVASINEAVIDTGIDLNYGSELNAVSGKNCVNSSNTAQDDNGHGTHVSGTIAAKNTGTGGRRRRARDEALRRQGAELGRERDLVAGDLRDRLGNAKRHGAQHQGREHEPRRLRVE